ncbi:hypothetical protein ACLOJK_031272 [Asimina triloba]
MHKGTLIYEIEGQSRVFAYSFDSEGHKKKVNKREGERGEEVKGNEADPRMKAASKRRGIEITSISRPIRPSDFKDFDLILAMDMQNKDDILEAFNKWKIKESLPDDAYKKGADPVDWSHGSSRETGCI